MGCHPFLHKIIHFEPAEILFTPQIETIFRRICYKPVSSRRANASLMIKLSLNCCFFEHFNGKQYKEKNQQKY